MSKLRVSGAGAKALEVDADMTLAELHRLLSPGSDELHEFVVAKGVRYGDPDADDQLVGRKVTDDSAVPVSVLEGKKVEYWCGRSSAVLKVGR
jgi:hypothetical protein